MVNDDRSGTRLCEYTFMITEVMLRGDSRARRMKHV
jgi:hypothetical protein